MGFKKQLIFFLMLSFVSINLVEATAFAQEEESTPVKSRPRRFVTLTIGLEHDEKLPPVPEAISFKGDFRKITAASFNKEENILRFVPKAEGIATLTVHDSKGRVVAEYHIDVKKSKLDAVVREMQSLLGDIEGITIKIVNNKVVVDGQILLPRDMNRIYNVVSQFGDQASSLVSLSPLAQKKIAEFIARDINNPEVEVRAINDKFVLSGWASSPDEKNRAEVIAKTYVPAVILEKSEMDGVVKRVKPANDGVINLINVKEQAAAPPPKIIQIVVHYVELQKDYSKGFRFQFTPSLKDESGMAFSTGSNAAGGFVSSITGTINNLLPRLNWAKQHGHARVLESTTIIVKDGGKGMLNSMQKIPYLTAQGKDGIPVTNFEPVGIKMSITPVLLGERSDSINLDLDFELSALIGMSDAGPLTSQNQMQTGIIVRSGQSAAVGGLITNRSGTNYNKLPKGAENPIISLYASKDFQRNQSQFVVFVTPVIKSSASAGSEKIKKKFRLRD